MRQLHLLGYIALDCGAPHEAVLPGRLPGFASPEGP
jgi:hypothetical protein